MKKIRRTNLEKKFQKKLLPVVLPRAGAKELKAMQYNKAQIRLQIFLEQPSTKKLLEKLSEIEKFEVGQLMSRHDLERINGIIRLGLYGSKKITPFLEIMLDDSNPTIVFNAIEKLHKINPRNSIPLIIRKLRNSEPDIRSASIYFLASVGAKESIPLIRKMLDDSDEGVRKEARKALATFGYGKNIELYGQHLLNPEFAGKTRLFVRQKQDKTGETILLGGKLLGKTIVRLMEEKNLIAWKKALEAGIPAEPILKKRGKYRIFKTKTGRYRVFAKVIKGMTVEAFLRNGKNKKRYWLIISEQIVKIKTDLRANDIIHPHLLPDDFVIKWVKDKRGKKYPKVFVIDFDRTYVRQNQ